MLDIINKMSNKKNTNSEGFRVHLFIIELFLYLNTSSLYKGTIEFDIVASMAFDWFICLFSIDFFLSESIYNYER